MPRRPNPQRHKEIRPNGRANPPKRPQDDGPTDRNPNPYNGMPPTSETPPTGLDQRKHLSAEKPRRRDALRRRGDGEGTARGRRGETPRERSRRWAERGGRAAKGIDWPMPITSAGEEGGRRARRG